MKISVLPEKALCCENGIINGFDRDSVDPNDFFALHIPTSIDGQIVKGIAAEAFFGAKNLVELKLSDNSKLEFIGSYAFANCFNLCIIDVNRPSVSLIDVDAFYRSGEIFRITASPNEVEPFGLIKKNFNLDDFLSVDLRNTNIEKVSSTLFNGAGIKTVYLPQTVTSIDEGAFESSSIECVNLKELKNLKTIKAKAFRQTAIKDIYANSLENIEINRFAFSECPNLTSIEIPETAVLNDSVFRNCPNLQKVVFLGKRTTINSRLFLKCSNLKAVKLPDGLEVIEKEAFAETASLKKIKYPETLKTIQENAFLSSAIVEFLPKTKPQIAEIEKGAFQSCYYLKNIDINSPSLNHIASFAFKETRSLKDINLERSSITDFEDFAFAESGLNTINFPYCLNSIGEYAFYSTDITAIDLSQTNIKDLASDCFSACFKLKSIKFPYFISNISKTAFSLTEIDVEEISKDYPFLALV